MALLAVLHWTSQNPVQAGVADSAPVASFSHGTPASFGTGKPSRGADTQLTDLLEIFAAECTAGDPPGSVNAEVVSTISMVLRLGRAARASLPSNRLPHAGLPFDARGPPGSIG